MMSRDPDVSWCIGHVYTSGIESYLHQTVFYFLRGQSGPTSTIATKGRNMQTNLHNDFYDCVLSFFPYWQSGPRHNEPPGLVSKREFTEPSVDFYLSSNFFISNKNQNGRAGLSFMLSALLCKELTSNLKQEVSAHFQGRDWSWPDDLPPKSVERSPAQNDLRKQSSGRCQEALWLFFIKTHDPRLQNRELVFLLGSEVSFVSDWSQESE